MPRNWLQTQLPLVTAPIQRKNFSNCYSLVYGTGAGQHTHKDSKMSIIHKLSLNSVAIWLTLNNNTALRHICVTYVYNCCTLCSSQREYNKPYYHLWNIMKYCLYLSFFLLPFHASTTLFYSHLNSSSHSKHFIAFLTFLLIKE